MKKITIMLLSEGARTVRQFKLPRFLIAFTILFAFCSAALLTWLFFDYKALKEEAPELARLRKENRQQEVQLLALSQKIQEISEQVGEMYTFDKKLKVMVNMDDGGSDGQFLGMGGSDPDIFDAEKARDKAHRSLVKMMHQSLDSLEEEVAVRIEEKKELYDYLKDQKAMLKATPSIWPTDGWVSSEFGPRISPFTEQEEFHHGLDICAPPKTPIVAPADGVVGSVGTNHSYGKVVTIVHGNGFKTRYAHLSDILVKKGERVRRGQEIALVGATGRTTGPHLHYEVHLNGVPVDPRKYILN
ncbi:MAG: peptidoglycan DD-metalloendopeptidase family protein [Desulfobacteraceae bacterium]